MRPNKLIVSDRPRTFRRVPATIPLLLFVTLAPASAWSQTPPPLAPRDMAMTMPGTFTFVSVGGPHHPDADLATDGRTRPGGSSLHPRGGHGVR